MPPYVAVVKVGGSLFDWPELGSRLHHWLHEHFDRQSVLLLPGGGPTTDVIRNLDRRHSLGEERAHWLALRALTLNAYFLADLLPSARVVGDVEACRAAWEKSLLPILDVHEFARRDEKRTDHLPHHWSAGSDAFAARLAVVVHARYLVLLKSTTLPAEVDWKEAAQGGWVDETFADALAGASADLQVRAVNLRIESG